MNRTARAHGKTSETDANDESRGTRERRGDDHQPSPYRNASRFTERLRCEFRELAKFLTCHALAPQPRTRRRRGQEEGPAAFRTAAATITRRRSWIPLAAYSAIAFLSETLDWLNPWHHPAGTSELHDEFQSDEEDHLSLRL